MIEINYSLILQVICVIFLYFILSKFLFKPIVNVLEERKSLIDGNMEKASEILEQNREKEAHIQETLDNCRKEMSKKLQEELAQTQKEYDEKMETMLKEGQEKLNQVKKSLELDVQEMGSKVDQYAHSICSLIMEKLGVR